MRKNQELAARLVTDVTWSVMEGLEPDVALGTLLSVATKMVAQVRDPKLRDAYIRLVEINFRRSVAVERRRRSRNKPRMKAVH